MSTAERAQDVEIIQREDALAHQRHRAGLAAPESWQTASEKACTECSEPIPDDRRRAYPGVRTCVDCQQLRERHLR